MIVVLYGYFSDSFPEWYLNDMDRTVIEYFQTRPKWLHSIFSIFNTVWVATQKSWQYVWRKPTNNASTAISKKEREEAVTRFILALSDQQLATGLAVLIAAMANRCTLTEYDFNMAFSLAWFSATTHLATLDCLTDYFQKHATVWKWRALGMAGIAALLIYGMVHNYRTWYYDFSLPVSCRDPYADIGTEYVDDVVKAASVLVSVFLVLHYCRRILWTYEKLSGRSGKDNKFQRIIFGLTTRGFRKQHQATSDEMNLLLQYAVAEATAIELRLGLERTRNRSKLKRSANALKRALNIYNRSFISRSPPLIFMISFGLSQVICSRWFIDDEVIIESSMGFGQITPLFLLVLPLLAGAEIYYGKCGDLYTINYNKPTDYPQRSERRRFRGRRLADKNPSRNVI